MNAIFAAQFASEIEAVTELGGEVLVRERAAALDEEQRQILREALDAVGKMSVPKRMKPVTVRGSLS